MHTYHLCQRTFKSELCDKIVNAMAQVYFTSLNRMWNELEYFVDSFLQLEFIV